MASGGEVGGSREQRSDVVHEYTCSTCSKSDQTTEASHYCPECDVCYCKLCLCDHVVIGRSKVEQWGKAAVTKDKAGDQPKEKLKCLRHPQYDIALYCVDHDVVCCSLCPATEHGSCVNMKEVNVAAQEIKLDDTITRVREGMSDLRRKVEPLGNEGRTRLIDLSHDIYIRQLRSIKASIDTKFEQIEEDSVRKRQNHMDMFKIDRLLSREITDTLAELEKGLEPSPEHTKHFICVKRAGEWIADNNKKLSNIHDNEPKIVCQKMSEDSARSILELVAKAGALKISGLHVNVKVRIEKDKSQCQIVGICQIENGNIVLADKANKRLKQLDGNYTVINDLELQGAPLDVCAAADGEVVVVMGTNKVIIAAVGAELKVVGSIWMTHQCSNVTYDNGRVYIVSNYLECIYVCAKRKGAMTQLSTINNIQPGRVCAIVNGHTQGLCIGGDRLTSYDLHGNKVTVIGDVSNVSNVLGLCVDNEGYMYVTQKGSVSSFQVSSNKFQSTWYLQKIKAIALPFDVACGPICYDKNTKCIVTCSQNRDFVYLVHTGFHGDNT